MEEPSLCPDGEECDSPDAVTIGDPAGKIESFEEKYTGDKIKAKYSAKRPFGA